MSDTIVRRAGRYNTEDVESALQLMALNRGSTRMVSEQTGIPHQTLSWWVRDKYAERYRQIRNTIIPKIQAELAARHEDMALTALEKQQEAFALMNLGELKQPDLVKAGRDLSVIAAVHTDKTQLLRDRPTQITEHRSPSETLDSIARRFPQGVVDAEAEEIEDVEEA